jgi:hypothetical protein
MALSPNFDFPFLNLLCLTCGMIILIVLSPVIVAYLITNSLFLNNKINLIELVNYKNSN